MRKMMLIDVSWIDNQIEDLKIFKTGSSVAKWRYDEQIELLEELKKQLQSPGEMIKGAFNAGKKLRYYEFGTNHKEGTDIPLTAQDYLIKIGYE